MKNLLRAMVLFAIIGLFAASCSKDSDNPTNNNGDDLIATSVVKNIETYRKDINDTVAYFSLRENKVIPMSEANTTNWDVAFLRTTIFVNSGLKGPGLGGAFVLRNAIYDDVKEVPDDSTFRTEDDAAVRAITTGSGKGWYNYNGATNEITPIPGVVLMIRTADGKFAKMKILSYYKGYPNDIPADVITRTDKTYSFQFVFQPNGSKSFKK